jgi:DNA-binding transcriptional LysR family regulator
MDRLRKIDANLLVALDVLLDEQQVTRAAQRLGITQSAMSQTLQRLRDALGDPLLVRSGSEMVMTPRAKNLAIPLRSALLALEQTLADPESFDPETSQRGFAIAMLDVYSNSVLPRLLRLLSQAGEGLSLDVRAMNVDTVWEQLRTGELDLALAGPRSAPADMVTATLIRERMVGLVREGHPLLDGELSVERYTHWPHAVFRLTGRGEFPIDVRLAELGVTRRIAGRTPFFLSAPWVVMESDIIMNLPLSAAYEIARRWPVRLFEPPIGKPMEYEVFLAWPGHMDSDPPHQWFREQILNVGRNISYEIWNNPATYGCRLTKTKPVSFDE